MTPKGAQAIEALRRDRGLVPDGPVIVSLVGRLPWWPEAAVVEADPAKTYRWDWLRGLEAHVWVRQGAQALPTLLAVLKAFPRFTWRRYPGDGKPAEGVVLWDVDKRSGAYVSLAWPEGFEADLDRLAMAGNWEEFSRVVSRRMDHPRLTVKAEKWDDGLNRQYAKNLAWMAKA